LSVFCQFHQRRLMRMKKIYKVLVIFILFNAFYIAHAQVITIPSKLTLTIPSGLVDVRYITIVNSSDRNYSIRTFYDSTWVFIFPDKFEVPKKEQKKILVVFFISKQEKPDRTGEILFNDENGKDLSRLKIRIMSPPPPVSPRPPRLPKKKPNNPRMEKINELKLLLNSTFSDELKKGMLQIRNQSPNLILIIPGPVIFDLGEEKPKEEARRIIIKLGEVLKKNISSDYHIIINGHADDLPIKNSYREKIPSNWELSGFRAATVARILNEEVGIPGSRISFSGFSSFQPITKGETLEEKAKNRRLEIIITLNKGQ